MLVNLKQAIDETSKIESEPRDLRRMREDAVRWATGPYYRGAAAVPLVVVKRVGPELLDRP